MNTKLTQIFGWLLLFLGVAIIFYGLYSSFNIFTGKIEIPTIIETATQKAEIPEAELPQKEIGLGPEAQMQKVMGEMMGQQLNKMIPFETIPQLLNLIAWSIFVWILISGGSHISAIGIKLLK